MPGARCWVGNKNLFVVWCSFPEYFGHVPGTVAVVDDQAVSLRLELMMGAEEGFRSRALKKRPRLGIQGSTQKIVRSRVTHVKLDCGIEFDQLHQVRLAESSLLLWRLRFERLGTQLIDGMQRLDTEANLLREAELQQSEQATKRSGA